MSCWMFANWSGFSVSPSVPSTLDTSSKLFCNQCLRKWYVTPFWPMPCQEGLSGGGLVELMLVRKGVRERQSLCLAPFFFFLHQRSIHSTHSGNFQPQRLPLWGQSWHSECGRSQRHVSPWALDGRLSSWTRRTSALLVMSNKHPSWLQSVQTVFLASCCWYTK